MWKIILIIVAIIIAFTMYLLCVASGRISEQERMDQDGK